MAVKCPFCGFENPIRSSFCNSCGKEQPSIAAQGAGVPQRHCVSCGRSIPDFANVCPYCGHDFRYQKSLPQTHETISGAMRILLYVLSVLIPIAGIIIGVVFYSRGDPESKHVGKMCLVLSVVGLLVTVGLAAALYVMVLGFGGTDGGQTPVASLSRSRISDGVKFTFTAVSATTTWSDVTILLSDGTNTCDWSPSTVHLSGAGSAIAEVFAPITLGSLTLFCNVTDIAGNGYINAGDHFTLTTGSLNQFSTAMTYSVMILYEPSAEAMCESSFNG